jgi:hypothetical protein
MNNDIFASSLMNVLRAFLTISQTKCSKAHEIWAAEGFLEVKGGLKTQGSRPVSSAVHHALRLAAMKINNTAAKPPACQSSACWKGAVP